jgi:hypothetical protein
MPEDEVKTFVDRDLKGALFNRSTLVGAVMRGVDVDGLDIDAPRLGEGTLFVNGVNVVSFVESTLNERFPGRDLKEAKDPDGLRTAWAAVERAWSAAVDRVRSMPEGSADVSIDDEYSFAQTLRHLVFATDTWLGRGIQRGSQPPHPLGLAYAEYEADGYDMSIFAKKLPSFAEVLEVRTQRQAMVRDFIATATPELLAEPRTTPWSKREAPVLHCLHVIIHEEWEHLRFALRDLDTLERRADRQVSTVEVNG